jgi:hypothetical protein
MITPGFLAGVNGDNAIRELIPSGSNVTQALIYFGALFLVALGVFTWAIVFHRQRGRRHLRHSPGPASRHHRPSSGRPRNRTLAEADGLPPVRTDKQPLSPA